MNPFDRFQDFGQNFGKVGLESLQLSFGAATKGGQAIAVELGDYTKQAFEQGTATLEKLAAARSVEKIIEIQTDYAKASYENLVARSTKMGELVTGVARDTFKPFEQAAAGVASTATA